MHKLHRNGVELIGDVDDDPVVHSGNSKSFAVFVLVTRERLTPQGRPVVNFHRITVYGGLVDYVANSIRKGDYVEVRGRLQSKSFSENYTDPRDIIMDVVAKEVFPHGIRE